MTTETMYECNACDWRGPGSETVHPKHDETCWVCPECNETITPVAPLPSKLESLCWLAFLNARATAIDWLIAEFGYNDEQVATYLSMQPVQVRMIRERDRRLDVKPDDVKAPQADWRNTLGHWPESPTGDDDK